LRWVFLLLLVQDLGCDKKFKHQVKESNKFKRDCNQIKENLYHGLISNEVEPRVSYTDSFYINKLAEIYQLSEEDRDLMIKALKPWKDKTSVTVDM
jgi:transaldolase